MGKPFVFSAADAAVQLASMFDSGVYENLQSWSKGVLAAANTELLAGLDKAHAAVVSRIAVATPAAQASLVPVYRWLYEWSTEGTEETNRYVLNFVPVMVWSYMVMKRKGEAAPGLETCLMGIHNSIANRRKDVTNLKDLRSPSVYHLTTTTGKEPKSTAGPIPGVLAQKVLPISSIIASNRGAALAVVLNELNSNLSAVCLQARFNFVELAGRLSANPSTPWQPMKKKFFGEKRSSTERLTAFGEDSEVQFVSSPPEALRQVLVGLHWCFYRTELTETADAVIQCFKARAADDLDPQTALHTQSLYSSTRLSILSN